MSRHPESRPEPAPLAFSRRNYRLILGIAAGAFPGGMLATLILADHPAPGTVEFIALAISAAFPVITTALAWRMQREGDLRRSVAADLDRHLAATIEREEVRNLLAGAHREGVFIFADDSILAASRRARIMFGLDEQGDLDERISDLIAPDERALFDAKAGSRNEAPFEITAIRRDDPEFPAAVTIGPCVFRGRRAAVAVVRDRSGEARIEEALKDSERQLRHSQKMEGVGMLAAGVAHDFNNILTVIGGHCAMLSDALEGHPSIRDVEPIEAAVDSATTLTRQLLAFSRKQVMNPRVVDLNDVVRGVTKMLGRMIGEDIRLELDLSNELSATEVDPGQVEQVIINLAVNARDAMPGGGTLTIKTGMVFLDQDYVDEHAGASVGESVRVCVSDTGCGMDVATAGRAFEPFFTTKGGGGTGLGLATVYGIVKQSGGYIDLITAPGRGTRFDIYLPVCEEDAEAPFDPETPRPEPESHGGTILLVEDNERVRLLVSKILTGHGYDVIVSPSGSDALLQAVNNTGPIDLLLADVVMPAMNGGETAEQFARLRPDTPVLFMTGYSGDVLNRHGMDRGDINLLEKPFSPAQLLNRVSDTIRTDLRFEHA